MPKRLSETGSPVKQKRFRPEKYANHVCGSIVRIRLENFMSHNLFEIEPGHRVNIITGVNGAGKSAILQAIVIALGKFNASFLEFLM